MEAARKVVSRMIRRINRLETMIVSAAAIIALVGGWLGSLLVGDALGVPRRTVWMVLSILLFVVPAVVAWTAERRRRRSVEGETGYNQTGDNRTEDTED